MKRLSMSSPPFNKILSMADISIKKTFYGVNKMEALDKIGNPLLNEVVDLSQRFTELEVMEKTG